NVAFGRMALNRRLNFYLRLYEGVLQSSTLLERIAVEFKNEKPLVEHVLQDLSSLNFVHTRPKTDSTDLAAHTLKAIEHSVSFLGEYMSHVRISFSEFLALQNVKASFKLQRFVLWLSVVATIATVLSAMASWPLIKSYT